MVNRIHILVVEDSAIAQAAIMSTLSQQGCIVHFAADAEEAKKKTETCRYDAILMDIGLGEGGDGFYVTNIIRTQSSLNKQTPIAAVSATDESNYRVNAEAIGMVGYFTKPFTLENAKKITSFIKDKQLFQLIRHLQ